MLRSCASVVLCGPCGLSVSYYIVRRVSLGGPRCRLVRSLAPLVWYTYRNNLHVVCVAFFSISSQFASLATRFVSIRLLACAASLSLSVVFQYYSILLGFSSLLCFWSTFPSLDIAIVFANFALISVSNVLVFFQVCCVFGRRSCR
jgi:hypothetical protein